MCIIVHKPADKRLTTDQLTDFFSRNPHGWGTLRFKGNRLKWMKGLDLPSLLKHVEAHNDEELLLHCRYRTHGDVDLANAHPFEVLSRAEGGPMYVMHNGVLSVATPEQGKSDTWHFIRDVLRPMLLKRPGLIHVEPWQKLLARHIGPSNKLAFMDGRGRTVIINADHGVEYGGCWYSNTYAWTYPPRARMQHYAWSQSSFFTREPDQCNPHDADDVAPTVSDDGPPFETDDVCPTCLSPIKPCHCEAVDAVVAHMEEHPQGHDGRERSLAQKLPTGFRMPSSKPPYRKH